MSSYAYECVFLLAVCSFLDLLQLMWFNYNPVSITDASEVLFFLCCDQVQLKWQSYAVKVTLSEVKMWVTDNAFLPDIHSYASLILIATIFHSINPLKQTLGSHLTTYSYQLCCWRNNTCFTFILGNFFSCFSFFFLKKHWRYVSRVIQGHPRISNSLNVPVFLVRDKGSTLYSIQHA